MAIIAEQYYTGDSTNRSFTVNGTILSESHIAVYVDNVRQPTSDYDIIGSRVLFNNAPITDSQIRILLSDDGEGLDTPPSAIITVSEYLNQIEVVSDNISSVNTVSAELIATNNIETVGTDLLLGADSSIRKVGLINTNVVAVSNEIVDINTVADNIGNVSIVGTDLSNSFSFGTDYGTITDPISNDSGDSKIGTVADNMPKIVSVFNNMNDINYAEDNATIATNKAQEASEYASDALDSANSANSSATEALGLKNTTNTYMTTTLGYKEATESYMDTTEGYKDTTLGYRNESEAFKNTATSQATIATTQASNSLTSANNASTSESNALEYRNKAELWANEDEDVEVESGLYSAKHWTLKAQDLVTNGVIDDGEVSLLKTYSSSAIESKLLERDNSIKGIILENTDINTIKTGGRYGIIGSGNTNTPIAGECYMEVLADNDGRVMQMLYYPTGEHYSRIFGTFWLGWFQHNTKSNVGLGNVDNTSDVNKPISTLTQNALNGKLSVGTDGTISQTIKIDLGGL